MTQVIVCIMPRHTPEWLRSPNKFMAEVAFELECCSQPRHTKDWAAGWSGLTIETQVQYEFLHLD